MPIEWKKKGLIFSSDGRYDWMYSHCQVPVADHVEDDIYKIYFASRTKEQRSHIGWVKIDLMNPYEILEVSSSPVLSPGPIGFFDQHGVLPSSIINVGGKKYLYYIGWNQGVEPPLFYAFIGLAISDDGGQTYYRYSKSPIIQRSEYDPCLVTSPNVIKDDNHYKMTYVSGIGWERVQGKLKSYYHIKYAESKDAIDWNRKGKIAIDFEHDGESNIARSSVLRENGLYKMWYSFVANEQLYRIGYAESQNGIDWERKDDHVGIDITPEGFDSDMICYPNVIKHQGRKYMFYNGNFFGKDGFGLAVSH